MQGGVGEQCVPQLRGWHAQCGPGTLYQATQGGGVDGQRQRRAEHAFVADQSHFQWLVPARSGHQGNNSGEREVNVTKRLIRFAEDLPENEINRLATLQNFAAIPAWQAIQ